MRTNLLILIFMIECVLGGKIGIKYKNEYAKTDQPLFLRASGGGGSSHSYRYSRTAYSYNYQEYQRKLTPEEKEAQRKADEEAGAAVSKGFGCVVICCLVWYNKDALCKCCD